MANFSRKLPPLNTLTVFEAAFRLRSFSRAADEVALSQASVSRQIRQLESNLGVRLFDRRRHDVMPTSEGEILAASVRLALHELASTAGQLRSTGRATESFTIFSDISIANVLVTPFLGNFQLRYPDIQFRVLSSYQDIDTVTEDFDIGFQTFSTAEERFDVEPIADDLVFPVCSPEFASRLPLPLSAVDLAKQPLLHLEDKDHGWTDWKDFLHYFRLKERLSIEGLTFNSYQVCLDNAEKGNGVALGWARSVKEKLNDGKLVRVSELSIPQPEGIYVYRHKLKKRHPIADEFIKTLNLNIEPINK